MKKYFFLFIVLVLSFAQFSCKSKKTEETNSQTQNENTDASSQKKYGIKSGIVNMDNATMGIHSSEILYFDDYGAKECSDMLLSGFRTKNVVKGGYLYKVDYSKKTYTKEELTKPVLKFGIDFYNLNEAGMAYNKLTKTGTENILGKECDIYSINNPGTKMTGTYSVYQGVPMKVNVETMDVPATLTVSKMEENVAIPDSVFEIPAEMKLQ